MVMLSSSRIASRLFRVPITSLSFGKRNFHVSSARMAPKKAAKNAKAEVEEEIELPDLNHLESELQNSLNYLNSELAKIRGGRASADMLNHVVVDAYGDKIPITETAQITLKTPTKLVISTFDSSVTPFVANAVRDCGLGFAPVVEGAAITVTVPKQSKEAREALFKVVSKMGEASKTGLRHARKSYMDKIKALKGKISEDDARKLSKDVDVATEKYTEKVNKIVKDKEAAILEV